jgi:acetate kinase
VREPALRVISCHLGGSSSVTGIRNGVAIGNSMGLSPQSGLPQNNRVGDLDAFALPFIMRSTGLTLDEAERLLCKESGLKAIVRRLQRHPRHRGAGRAGRRPAQNWRWMFLRIKSAIGSARIFCNSTAWTRWYLRPASAKIAPACARPFAAISINLASFSTPSSTRKPRRGKPSSARRNRAVKIIVIPTNEELVVAREVRRFLQNH